MRLRSPGIVGCLPEVDLPARPARVTFQLRRTAKFTAKKNKKTKTPKTKTGGNKQTQNKTNQVQTSWQLCLVLIRGSGQHNYKGYFPPNSKTYAKQVSSSWTSPAQTLSQGSDMCQSTGSPDLNVQRKVYIRFHKPLVDV